jgi:thymidylate synthase ThyX
MLLDYGIYRDLQRHRICSPERPKLTTKLGYVLPPEIVEAKAEAEYKTAMEKAAEISEKIACHDTYLAQYSIPFGYRIRWTIEFNAREAFHLLELRTGRDCHQGYRKAALDMYEQIKTVHPNIAASMKFIDTTPEYPLKRMRAEIKTELKKRKAE